MDNHITVKEVIFHDPATIVYWGDGTKTVVKCMEGDIFNPELGMAMCMLKRMLDPPSYARYKRHTKELVDKYDAKHGRKTYVEALKTILETIEKMDRKDKTDGSV